MPLKFSELTPRVYKVDICQNKQKVCRQIRCCLATSGVTRFADAIRFFNLKISKNLTQTDFGFYVRFRQINKVMESKDVDKDSPSPKSDHKSDDEAEGSKYDGERKSEINFPVLEGLDQSQTAMQQPIYQIRPPLSEKFKPMSAKEVIHNVLFDQLSTKVYDAKEVRKWCQEIADTIRDKVKELKFKRYKYIVNVVMGEHRGAGVKMGTRCIWDAEADSYAYDNFLNVRKLLAKRPIAQF